MTAAPVHKLDPAQARARLELLGSQMEKAAQKAGRQLSEITLLAVSKTFPSSLVKTYLELGQLDFGESYMQEARAKAEELSAEPTLPRWHFIGHLQTNKAKYAAPIFHSLHSLDSLDLARELNKRLEAEGRKMTVYIQVNVSGEESKSGLSPTELPAFLEALAPLAALKPAGLMTMPPWDPDPEAARPHFAALRELRDKQAPHLTGLSMGMSGDFPVAIEEGATVVRVGTALFGSRA